MPMPKDPAKREEVLRNMREAAHKRSQDPEWRRKNKEQREKILLDPISRRKHREGTLRGARKRAENPEYVCKNKERLQKLHRDPEFRSKHREGTLRGARKRSQNPEWRRNQKIGAQKRIQDPEWRCNNKAAMQKRFEDPEFKCKNKEMLQKLSQDPEWRHKNKERAQKMVRDPEYKLKQKEGLVGGFCIQNITYRDPPRYCELWCPDLWHRIDEAQNYQSILSGKTKFENGGRALSRHHVYWQPKACCEWDEDAQGYFAMINIGTRGKPNWYKHYIPDDPNKFVLLTKQEHGMVAKDKLKWIKIFEDLIETKLGGVCYLQKSYGV
jgi:hypothetical protein